MSFFGKEYTFEKQENFEEFVNALGFPEEDAKRFLNLYPNQKLEKDGDSYKLIIITPKGDKEILFKLGVPFQETIFDHTCQSTCTMEGNTLVQVQNFSKDGNIFTFAREYSDTGLIVTVTSNKSSAIARRFYKAV